MKKLIFLAIVSLFAMTTVSAQDRGQWAVTPQIGVYTNMGNGDGVFAFTASARYGILENLRVQPGLAIFFEDGCSVDISADLQRLWIDTRVFSVYSALGLSANDIFGWSCGINLGGGVDLHLTRNWDLTANMKWMIQTASNHPNPLAFNIGASFKF